jgi:hypothetical protein
LYTRIRQSGNRRRRQYLAQEGHLEAEDAEVPLLATSVDKVVRAYNEAVLGGTQTVTWAKLMFIGQGRAGKTSLLRNLTNQGFQADEGITDGADVCIVSNGMWGKTEEMARGNFDKGVAEVVGGKVGEETDGGQRPWYSRRYMLVVCALALVGGLVVGLDPRLLHQSLSLPPTPINWSGLQETVKAAAGQTVTITLAPSFTMVGYDGSIYLQTDGTVVTIEGHGATFDAKGKGNFFHVGYENAKVSLTLRDVTMKNVSRSVLLHPHCCSHHLPSLTLPFASLAGLRQLCRCCFRQPRGCHARRMSLRQQ